MSDIRLYAPAAYSSPSGTKTPTGVLGLRDGALATVPWMQMLVFEGKVFGFHAGDVTTAIAGHASVDADQPEIALRVPDGTVVMPLVLKGASESGATTLGVHAVEFSVSNIDVANGTSTAFNTTGVPLCMRIDNPATSACIGRHTYSGNGTDPLTAGNFIELGRAAHLLDSDAATSGLAGLSLAISAHNQVMPMIWDAGSIVGYGEGSTSAVFFFSIMHAEFSEADMT